MKSGHKRFGLSLTKGCIFTLSLVFLPAGSAWASGGESGLFFKSSGTYTLSLPEVVDDLRTARVVFLGENHGDYSHHLAQYQIIRSLHESGVRLAIGMEMFNADVQSALERWISGEMDPMDMYRLFQNNWYLDYWPLYRDILFYAREQKIPLLGLNIPAGGEAGGSRKEPNESGSSAQTETAAGGCDASPKYLEILTRAFGEGAHGTVGLKEFCGAQIAVDSFMARGILEHSRLLPDSVIVVMAGTFHAWRQGIPRQLGKITSYPVRIVLPSNDDSILNYDAISDEADYMLLLDRRRTSRDSGLGQDVTALVSPLSRGKEHARAVVGESARGVSFSLAP